MSSKYLERPIDINSIGFSANLAINIPSGSLNLKTNPLLGQGGSSNSSNSKRPMMMTVGVLFKMIQQDLDNIEDRATPGGEVIHPAFGDKKIDVFKLNKFREYLGKCFLAVVPPTTNTSQEFRHPKVERLSHDLTIDELSRKQQQLLEEVNCGNNPTTTDEDQTAIQLQLGLEIPLCGPLTFTFLPHSETPKEFNDLLEQTGGGKSPAQFDMGYRRKLRVLPFTEERSSTQFDVESLWSVKSWGEDRAGHNDCTATVLVAGDDNNSSGDSSAKILRLGSALKWDGNKRETLRELGITPGSTVVVQAEAHLTLKVEILRNDDDATTPSAPQHTIVNIPLKLPFYNTTVHMFKQQIEAVTGIPVSDQRLTFTKQPMTKLDTAKTERLERNENLSFYRLSHLDVIQLHVRSSRDMELKLRFLFSPHQKAPVNNEAGVIPFPSSQKLLPISLPCRASVSDLREAVVAATGVPAEHQYLYTWKQKNYSSEVIEVELPNLTDGDDCATANQQNKLLTLSGDFDLDEGSEVIMYDRREMRPVTIVERSSDGGKVLGELTILAHGMESINQLKAKICQEMEAVAASACATTTACVEDDTTSATTATAASVSSTTTANLPPMNQPVLKTEDILLSYDYKKFQDLFITPKADAPASRKKKNKTVLTCAEVNLSSNTTNKNIFRVLISRREKVITGPGPRDVEWVPVRVYVNVTLETTVLELMRVYSAHSVGLRFEEMELQIHRKEFSAAYIMSGLRGETMADYVERGLREEGSWISYNKKICEDDIGRMKNRALLCGYGLPFPVNEESVGEQDGGEPTAADDDTNGMMVLKLDMIRKLSSGPVDLIAKFPMEQDEKKKSVSITVDRSETMTQVKTRLGELTGKDPKELRITYAHRFTEESKTVGDLWMKSGEEISVMPPLRGGMYTTASGRRDFGVARPAVMPVRPTFFKYSFSE